MHVRFCHVKNPLFLNSHLSDNPIFNCYWPTLYPVTPLFDSNLYQIIAPISADFCFSIIKIFPHPWNDFFFFFFGGFVLAVKLPFSFKFSVLGKYYLVLLDWLKIDWFRQMTISQLMNVQLWNETNFNLQLQNRTIHTLKCDGQ